MRLLEYHTKQFFKDCEFKLEKRNVVEQIGFLFGIHEFLKMDFWLKPDNDYTDKDFIKAVYEENLKTNKITEMDLISALSRFLCEYDVQFNCRKQVKDLPSHKQSSFFQNIKDSIDDYISAEDLNSKVKFIKETLNID